MAPLDVANLRAATKRHGSEELVTEDLDREIDSLLSIVLFTVSLLLFQLQLTERPQMGIRPTQQ